MRRNVYSSAVFTGQPLCTQIFPEQNRPRQTFWRQKTRDTELTDGEDASFCVPSF